MTPPDFEPSAWIATLAHALSELATAQELYWNDLDKLRQQRIRSQAERPWSIAPPDPSDDLKRFYYHACHSKSRYLAGHYAPLRSAYANVLAILAAHPSWSSFLDPSDGSGEFWIQTTTTGGLQSLSLIVGGLMTRALEVRENRFVTAAIELHRLLEPAREQNPPPAPGSLSVGYHVALLHGLSISSEFRIAEDMALVPFDQVRDFVNESVLNDIAPKIVKFNDWQSVAAIVRPFDWKPAFAAHGNDSRPSFTWGNSFFEDAQAFIELLAMFHAGPVVCLVTIPYCIHRTASRLLGQPHYHGSVRHGPMARSFDRFAKSGPANMQALHDARKAFQGRTAERFKDYAPIIARLAEALARSGRFQDDDKILDVAIALERLYQLDGGEISFKLKTRAACYLETATEDRLRVFHDVGDFYKARSSIVHRPRQHSSTEVKSDAFNKGFEVARRTVVTLLEHGPPSDWDELIVRAHDATDAIPDAPPRPANHDSGPGATNS